MTTTRKDAQRSDSFHEGLPIRVEQLETSVASLHQDSIRTQSALAALAGQVDGLSDTLRDIADKLDAQRTRRPEMGALATWAIVILTIGALAFAPLMRQQERFHERLLKQKDLHLEDTNNHRKALRIPSHCVDRRSTSCCWAVVLVHL